MHIHVDPSSPLPPYEQLRAQIHAMVASGTLREGARLPPIRQLAGDLGLASNTVGRAYHELERDGIVQTRGRHGTIVTGTPQLDARDRRRVLDDAARSFVHEADHHGAGLDDALAAVRRAYEHLRDHGTPLPEGTNP